jgi:hypothetical protein
MSHTSNLSVPTNRDEYMEGKAGPHFIMTYKFIDQIPQQFRGELHYESIHIN